MKPRHTENARYHAYLEAEREAVALYTAMADAEPDPRRSKIFRRLVEAEERHVAHWSAKLGLCVDDLPPYRPRLKIKMLGWLARQFGTQGVLPLVMRIEGSDTDMYAGEPEARDIMDEEKRHSRTLQDLKEGRYPASELGGGVLQKAAAGGAFRAAVLGGNDGLISNLGIVWGVAGGTSNPDFVLLAGVAGLVAGAISMSAGEYVSIRAGRDLAESQIEKERHEIEQLPEEEKEELSLIYQLKGLNEDEANILAERIMQDPEVALETMAREELGLNPSQLGSPWSAAVSSFIAFAAGAFVPLIPYVLRLESTPAFAIGGSLTALALLITGSSLAYLSGKHPLRGGFRMLAIGAGAALITYSIGRLVGISLS